MQIVDGATDGAEIGVGRVVEVEGCGGVILYYIHLFGKVFECDEAQVELRRLRSKWGNVEDSRLRNASF